MILTFRGILPDVFAHLGHRLMDDGLFLWYNDSLSAIEHCRSEIKFQGHALF